MRLIVLLRLIDQRPDGWLMVHDPASGQVLWAPPGTCFPLPDRVPFDIVHKSLLETGVATEILMSGFQDAHADLRPVSPASFS